MMDLTSTLVEEKAATYRETQPLAAVEAQHLDILPGMLRSGEYGWRDVEWVVQWYYRRYLGAYPDRERRAVEAAFGDNTYEAVAEALARVSTAETVEEKLGALTALEGVDIPVASAYLFFMAPESYLAVDDRQWRALEAAGRLGGPYPDPPSVDDYLAYLETCRPLAEDVGVDLATLYRALWRLGTELAEAESG